MKHIIIGDIHAKPYWREVVAKHQHDQAVFVFLGDYFDSFDGETSDAQIDNFHAICEMRENNPERCVMLLGNHDYHYLPGIKEHYSGYQKGNNASRIGAFVNLALAAETLQVAYSFDNFIFTHAGVTSEWLARAGIKEENNLFIIARHINQLFERDKSIFGFYKGDTSGCGDNVNQSPLWVRPDSLICGALEGFNQCVGHTMVDKLQISTMKFGKSYTQLLFNDCLHNRKYCIINEGGLVTECSL